MCIVLYPLTVVCSGTCPWLVDFTGRWLAPHTAPHTPGEGKFDTSTLSRYFLI